jgi:hypothetical protein
VNAQTVSIPLDLPSPIAGYRWSIGQEGKRRPDAIGHRIEWEFWLSSIALADAAALHRNRFITL